MPGSHIFHIFHTLCTHPHTTSTEPSKHPEVQKKAVDSQGQQSAGLTRAACRGAVQEAESDQLTAEIGWTACFAWLQIFGSSGSPSGGGAAV